MGLVLQGQVQGRLGARDAGLRLGQVGGQGRGLGVGHRGLVAADVVLRAAAVGVRLGGDGGGAVLVRVPARHPALGHEGVVARAVGLRPIALGVRGADGGLGGADVRGRQVLLGVQRHDGRLGRRHRGLGVLQVGRGRGDAGVELLRIDPRQGIAAPDRLVVAHQHLGHQATDLGRDNGTVRLDIGGVGGFGGLGHDDVGRASHGHGERDAHRQKGAAGERQAAWLGLHQRGRGRRRVAGQDVVDGDIGHWKSLA